MLRRRFLAGLLAALSFGITGPRKARAQQWSGYEFRHGVASGDPLADRVILWTRISDAGAGPVRVEWRVTRDPELREVVTRGSFTTGAQRDFTVKVDALGLEPGQDYYFRFYALGERSPVGRTRTLSVRAERIRIALASCASYPHGYFNAYRRIAERNDLFVVEDAAGAPVHVAATGDHGQAVCAPLAGNIFKINVAQGQGVNAGDVLMIMEAMKMETEVRAPAGGTVSTINVKEGDAVQVGDPLLTVV